MSKNLGSILRVFVAFAAILQFFTETTGHGIEAAIRIDGNRISLAQISGRTAAKCRNLSFFPAVVGVDNLGERVSQVSLFDEAGNAVTYKKFIAGEYVADADFTSWSYKIDLTPPKNRTAAAHVSWLTDRSGLLMLGDILPQFAVKDAKVKVDLPPEWRAFSNNREWPKTVFETSDFSKSVIFVGRDLSEFAVGAPGKLNLIFDGEWNFKYGEAGDAAKEIYLEYSTLFGTDPNEVPFAAVLKFPENVSVGNWEADTRGKTITILSSDMPFKSQSLQRLHEQLRHEMFHLWLPNGINLSGQYDWFYEGFALYRSLKLGVAVNRIRFEDFLDTLSRAYTIDRLSSQKVSLIDASKNRWAGANTRVYARGMLVAFLCDVAMLDSSEGKRSIDNLLRELYQKHKLPSATTDANTAILTLMRSHKELASIAEFYVTGREELMWASDLKKAGIDAMTRDQLTTLTVVAKPSGRQKDLLDKLGYNSWRKLGSGRQ